MALKRRKRRGKDGKFVLFSLSLPSLFIARHEGYRPIIATEFSPFCSKKLNNAIHWISLYPLVNAIGFPTPGIWPLNLPGEPSWRERHSLSLCLGRIGIRGGKVWTGRDEKPGTRDYMMISKTSISCRLSRPPFAAFTFSQKLSAGCQPEKKANNPGRQFFFSLIRHSSSSKFHIWESVYFSNNL